MRKPGALIVTGLCGSLALAALCLKATAEPNCCFVWLDSKRLDMLAGTVGVRHWWETSEIYRTAPGTKLILTIETNSLTRIHIFSESGTEVKLVAGTGWITDEGRSICTATNNSLVFADGSVLARGPGTTFGFTPDRAFFFFSSAPTNQAAIFQTASPQEPLFSLPPGFLPQHIFARSNELLVFGQQFQPDKRGFVTYGLVLSKRGTSITVGRQINLSRFGSILDMDTKNSALLVDSKRDTLRTWGIYDLSTGKYRSLGLMRGRIGFFLSPALTRYLESLWR